MKCLTYEGKGVSYASGQKVGSSCLKVWRVFVIDDRFKNCLLNGIQQYKCARLIFQQIASQLITVDNITIKEMWKCSLLDLRTSCYAFTWSDYMRKSDEKNSQVIMESYLGCKQEQQWFKMAITAHQYEYLLRWRHNGRDSVSNHQSRDCLLNRLFGRR